MGQGGPGGQNQGAVRSIRSTARSHIARDSATLLRCIIFSYCESGVGLVSRVTPVHTALRNCMRDKGRPFGFGDQVADPKPPQAAVVKSDGGERCGNVGAMISAGKIERGERKQTASEASKSD